MLDIHGKFAESAADGSLFQQISLVPTLIWLGEPDRFVTDAEPEGLFMFRCHRHHLR